MIPKLWRVLRDLLAISGLFVLVVVGVDLVVSSGRQSTTAHALEIPYSVFLDDVAKGHVRLAQLKGQNVTGVMTDGRAYRVTLPAQLAFADALAAKQVQVRTIPDESPDFMRLLLSWLPMAIYCLVFWLFVGRPLNRLVATLNSTTRRSD